MTGFRCAALIVVLIGGACTDGSDSTDLTAATTATTTMTANTYVRGWAWEAEEFAELLIESDPEYATQFYAPTAVVEVPYSSEPGGDYALGRDAIFWFKDRRIFRNIDQVVHEVFVAQDRIALLLYPKWFGYVPVPELVVYEIDNGLVSHETHSLEASELRTWAISSTTDDRLQSLYEAYIAAMRSGDVDDIAALYRPDARRTDGLLGGVWQPVGGMPEDPAPTETFLSEPQHYSSHEAIFTTGAAETATGPVQAHALFEVFAHDFCRFRMLAIWELEDFQIVDELLLYEVSSPRACQPYLEVPLPTGWWTGWEPPPLITETVTGQITGPDGSEVEIINGSHRKNQLVEWGLDRFTVGGLIAPRVDAVAFPPTHQCHEVGLSAATYQAATVRIDICLRDFLICSDDTCEPLFLPARYAILHELAHAWLHQNVGTNTQQAFLDLRGLDSWRDPTVETDQGVEQAVETIAWGLIDSPDAPIRIEDATPEQLLEAYRLLTDTTPPHTTGHIEQR